MCVCVCVCVRERERERERQRQRERHKESAHTIMKVGKFQDIQQAADPRTVDGLVSVQRLIGSRHGKSQCFSLSLKERKKQIQTGRILVTQERVSL